MTKLCDLGMDVSVCSVGWAQRGTHLAVGTSNGKLQVGELVDQISYFFSSSRLDQGIEFSIWALGCCLHHHMLSRFN